MLKGGKMGLNKQTGDMYAFVTHTWNPIRGKCPHDCLYCYMKEFPQRDFRFVEQELNTELGNNRFIFVGSSTDMWVRETQSWWLDQILTHCKQYDNRYLFQSKNPERFRWFEFPPNTILGTTIETDRSCDAISQAPAIGYRVAWMKELDLPKMVSIEPIMDFDLDYFVNWISQIAPEFVSIGADSKGHKLPEPTGDKVLQLITALQKITTVKIKNNLDRLLGQ